MTGKYITVPNMVRLAQRKIHRNARVTYTISDNKRGWFVLVPRQSPMFIGRNKYDAYAFLYKLKGNRGVLSFIKDKISRFQPAFLGGAKQC